MEEKERDYKERIKNLIEEIKRIEKKSLQPWEKSDEIMELLRRQYLLVHTNYLKKKRTEEHFATLNFKEEGIKLPLNKVDENYKEDEDIFDYHVIYGNSFGPFNPKAYFECDNKILWLLKEPYIYGIGCWIGENEDNKPDRGGHDQAKEFKKWEDIEGKTILNIVKITRTILSKIDKFNENYWRNTDKKLFRI